MSYLMDSQHYRTLEEDRVGEGTRPPRHRRLGEDVLSACRAAIRQAH